MVELFHKCSGKRFRAVHAHSLFLALSGEPKQRQSNYRALFDYLIEGALLEAIRDATNKGLALGNERFEEEVESLTGRRMTAKKRGEACRLAKEGGNELMFSLLQLFYVSCKIKVPLRSF